MTKIVMKDIAKELNVSVVAISKALNDKEGISDELKKKIKNKAAEMGYQNNNAKIYEANRPKMIGVIIPKTFISSDINSPSFYLDFFQKISEGLQERGYFTILYTLSMDSEKENILPRILQENMVEGMIFMAQAKKEYLQVIEKLDIPKICLDFYINNIDIDCVITDNFLGAYELTSELISNGHEEIGFIGTLGATSSINDRYLGYQKALLEKGCSVKNEYVIDDRNINNQYIEFELPQKMPTAFVCNNDKVAYDLIKKLKSKGIRIPEDVSVVGFDDANYSRLSDPKITTVRVNKDEMVKAAIDNLTGKIENKYEDVGNISIKGTMIKRDSVMKRMR